MIDENKKPIKRFRPDEWKKLSTEEKEAYKESIKPENLGETYWQDISYEDCLYLHINSASFTAHKSDFGGYKLMLQSALENRPKNEEFYFIWSDKCLFSRFYYADFNAPIYFHGEPLWKKHKALYGNTLITYSSIEQFIMYYKALIFGDVEISKKIMQTSDIKDIKKLGEEINNIDEYTWDYWKQQAARRAIIYKFSNNLELMKKLVDTYPKTLVEASPDDTLWGIGLSKEDERTQQRSRWLGENLFGELLTNFRNRWIENKRPNLEYPYGSL